MPWELHQNARIASASQNAEHAAHKADYASDEVARIHRRLDRLTLSCQAMWELIRERTSITDAELEAKIVEVDLRDGIQDGKMSQQICVCQACGRNTNSRRQNCLMCGAVLVKEHLFEG